MTATFFAPAPTGVMNWFDDERGVNLAGNPALYDNWEDTLGTLRTAIRNCEYPGILDTLLVVEYRYSPVADQWGNNIVATIMYNDESNLTSWGGHVEPVGDAGEGRAIVWQVYAD